MLLAETKSNSEIKIMPRKLNKK